MGLHETQLLVQGFLVAMNLPSTLSGEPIKKRRLYSLVHSLIRKDQCTSISTVHLGTVNLIFSSQEHTLRIIISSLVGTTLKQLSFLAPNAPALYNTDGSLNWMPHSSGMSSFDNPLQQIYRTVQVKTVNVVGNMSLQYQLLQNLFLEAILVTPE